MAVSVDDLVGRFSSEEDFDEFIARFQQRQRWYPDSNSHKVFENVPEHIASAASESYACLGIDAYRAAVQLARSVVEATAKEKGITNGSLKSKIDTLKDNECIRRDVQEAAHEIRYLGNEMAHGDFVSDVTKEEVVETLALMEEVLHDVYQTPARIERLKLAREARMAELASTKDAEAN